MTTATAAGAPGLEEWLKESNDKFLLEFSRSRPIFELSEPPRRAVPHCWKWADMHALMLRSAELTDVEKTFRRSLMFSNPGLFPQPFMTATLDGAISLYNPGERATVHRHTPSASRFGIEGTGGFTTVEGEKCTMERGDLIMTPNRTWHDMGNEGDEQIFFLDVVNDPLVLALGGTFYEFGYTEIDPNADLDQPVEKSVQSVKEPLEHSQRLYAAGGLVPRFTSHQRGRGRNSPMFVYRYAQTREMLDGLRDYEGSPYDGITIEYVNPTTGESAMPTMTFQMQLLRPAEHTLAHRHTTSTAYCVVEGEGATQIGDMRLEWRRNDVFVVPGWMWHEHVNQSDGNAVLFSVSDEAAVSKLGLYREQGRSPDGEIVTVED